jgi:hypothetical protein
VEIAAASQRFLQSRKSKIAVETKEEVRGHQEVVMVPV